MKRRSRIGTRLLLGLSLSALAIAERVVAGEPLPDASVLAARPRTPKPPAQPKEHNLVLYGVVGAVEAKGLTITAGKTSTSTEEKEWLILAQADSTELTIRGTATPDYLRKGQTVEFSGQIVSDEKAADEGKEERLADKVKELKIVSRKSKKGGAREHVAHSGGGGRTVARKPEADSEPTSTAPDDDSKTKAKPAAKPAAGGPKTKIAGEIISCDGKGLTVFWGERTVHVDLADEATIKIELVDPKLDQEGGKNQFEGAGPNGHLVTMLASDLVGAKIVVHGKGMESESGGNQCMAKRIDITLAAPLAGTKSTSADAKKSPADK